MIRPTLRRFFLLAVPVLLVAGLGLKLLFDQYEKARFDAVAARESGYLRAVETLVQQELDEVIADLDTLVAAVELQPWTTDRAALDRLAPVFAAHGRENGRYDQLRLLDTEGMERLRLNFRDGRLVVVPEASLQDKSGRRYFKAIMALTPDERFVSALELNQEHGRIEKPLTPVIRFGAAVYAPDGARAGMVVLNYRADRLEANLRTFAEVGDSVTSPVGNLLVNERGEVIMDAEHGLSDWLLRATRGEDTRLATLRPDWWSVIAQNGTAGRSMTKAGLLIFESIRPLSQHSTDHVETLVTAQGEQHWTVIRFIPAEALFANSFIGSRPGRVATGAMLGGMALFLFMAAWYLERDARGRRQRMALLEDRKADLKALIDATPSGILVADEAGVILHANRELCRLFGYRADELEGQRIEVLIPDRLQVHHPDLRARYFAHPSPRKMAENTPEQNLVARHRSGREMPVAVNLNLFQSATGPRAIATVIDVSRRRQFEAQLKTARDEAQAAYDAKSAFLATMSHEIRTPLNAIVGMSYLMGQGTLDAGQRRDVEAIQSSSKALLALINDVLDVSRIEAGELVIEQRVFLLSDLLKAVGSMFRGAALDKGIALDIGALPEDVPDKLRSDPSRLHQMLVNLVGNAVKFTASGHVRVRVERVGEGGEGTLELRLTVSDSGIGIDPSRLPTLFDPFVQADSSTSRMYGGSGLGLSIVKRLAGLMGGSVGCESQPGEGSRFWLTLPVEVPDPSTPLARADRAGRKDVHILLASAEHEEAAADIGRICASFDWLVTRTRVTPGHIQAVCDRASSGAYDCVLIDAPTQLDALVRAMNARKLDVPVLAISDNADAPCARVARPLTPPTLFNAINAAIVAAGGAAGQLSAESDMPEDSLWLAGVRALAVDDSELNLQVIERLLALQGAKVTTCQSGEEALAIMNASGAYFDVILMDLQMPGLDGVESTQRIKAARPHDCPPIIALSAGAGPADTERAAQAGMCEYLTKPVDPQVLVRVLRRCIETSRGQALALEAASDSHEAAAPWPQLEGIDGSLSAELMLGDADFFASVLETFVHHTATVGEAMQAARRDGQWRTMAAKVHKLRGQAANVGARHLQLLAGALEHQLGEHDGHGVPAEALDHLIDALDTVRVSASAWLDSRGANPPQREET